MVFQIRLEHTEGEYLLHPGAAYSKTKMMRAVAKVWREKRGPLDSPRSLEQAGLSMTIYGPGGTTSKG